MSEKSKLISDAKRWVEQEKVWDGSLYATQTPELRSPGASEKTVPSPTPRRADAPTRDGGKVAALKALNEKYKDCVRCSLGTSRIKFVFGVGNPDTDVLFIGEGPGFEEDHR